MKRNGLAAVLGLAVCLMTGMVFPAYGEVKAGASELKKGGYLDYQARELTWDEDKITVTGSFVNNTKDKDIYDINSASLEVKDKKGTVITSTTLNSGDLSKVQIGPGEQWEYVVKRTVEGFDPGRYDLKTGFSVSLSCEMSVRSHEKNCSYCAARSDTSFSTEDRYTQEQWQTAQAVLAELKKESAAQSSGSSGGYDPDLYDDPLLYSYTPPAPPEKRMCDHCFGAGKIRCEKCGGLGYKMVREQAFSFVGDGSYWRKEKCYTCGGDGKVDCRYCIGGYR